MKIRVKLLLKYVPRIAQYNCILEEGESIFYIQITSVALIPTFPPSFELFKEIQVADFSPATTFAFH
jgi:hypothetical protein